MDDEFTTIWKAIGWEEIDPVWEEGSRLLTIQFLCSLKEVNNGITFCLFERVFLHLERSCPTHRFPSKMLT